MARKHGTPLGAWLLCLVMVALAGAGSASAATVSLPLFSASNPDHHNGTSDDVVVPVTVSPADGVTTLDLSFTYTASLMTATGAYRTGYANGFAVTPNLSTPGTVTIHMTSGAPLSGSGEVVWVVFRITGAAGSTSPLTWVSAVLNGGAIPATTQSGSVKISAGSATISAPDTATGVQGTDVVVPLSTTTITNATSFDLSVRFNPFVVSAVDVQRTSLTSAMTLVFNNATPGTVNIALFGAGNVSGAGALVTITFHVTGANATQTPLNIVRADIDEGSITTVIDDGLFTATCNGPPPPAGSPQLTLSKQPGNALVSWTALAGATAYDVVRGSVSVLESSHGDFTAATQQCVANDNSTTSIQDPANPAAGSGLWYLVRGVNCGGNGTYDTGAMSQVGLRDAEIQAAAAHCP